MKISTLVLTLVAISLASSVRGAIILESSRFLVDADAPINPTFDIVNETGGNNNTILLLGSTMDSASVIPSDEVTLTWTGGTAVAGTQLITASGGQSTQVSLWAWDLGNLAAAETVTFNNASTAGREVFSMIQLSGATLTSSATASSGGSPTTATATFASGLADADFVFGIAMVRNNGRSVSSTSANIDVSGYANLNSRGAFYMYDSSAVASSPAYSFTLSGSSDGVAFASVALAAVPEPSAALLLACGFGVLVLRRRRA